MHCNRVVRGLITAASFIAAAAFVPLSFSAGANFSPVLSTRPMPLLAAAPMQSNAKQLTTTSEPKGQVWNLKNADIRAVIQTISVLTGKSFLVDPRVQGRVTLISHTPMIPRELYQVFLSMLKSLNFSAVTAGNVIKIVPAEDGVMMSRTVANANNPGTGDEIVVRVVPIEHVSATQLVPVLRPLMSQSATVTAYMPSNSLILAGTASNIKRLMTLIHQMDDANRNQVSVVPLHYADAKKVVSVIQSLQDTARSQGRVANMSLAADEDNNSILISASLANQLMVKNLIKQLDKKGQGGFDTKVIKLNYLTAKKFAPILAKVASGISAEASEAKGGGKDVLASSTASKVSIQSEDNTNAIIMRGPKPELASLVRVINRLDSRPQEVLVEAIIVRVDENVLDQLGIVWGTTSTDSNGNTTGTQGAQGSDGTQGSASNTFGVTVGSHGVGLLPGTNLTALIHLLKSNGETDVLSTPSVVVLNNQKAEITDGQNVGLANRSYQGVSPNTNESGNTVTQAFNTVKRTDVALSLQVTPHVSPNNMIRMALNQQDNTIAQEGGENGDNPTLNVSKIKTSVLVKSGDVLVLGGLIDNEQAKTKQKLPILGDLPLIGHLFRYNTHQLTKKSLMVFIRPIVMTNGVAKRQTMHRYQFVRQQQIEGQTERLRKSENLSLLPRIKGLPLGPKLPEPVNRIALPIPRSTQLMSK